MSFVGLSYGTLIGLLWAEAYPGIRPGDGARRRGRSRPQRAMSPSSDQIAGDRHGLRGTSTRPAPPTPRCPLRRAGGVLAAYDELARRLEAGDGQRQRRRARPSSPTPSFYATYGSERWPDLWHGHGRRAWPATCAAWPTWPAAFTGLVPLRAVRARSRCLDAPHPVGFDAWRAAADRAARASPRFGRHRSPTSCSPARSGPGRRQPRPHVVAADGTPPILVHREHRRRRHALRAGRAGGRRTSADGVLLTVDLDGPHRPRATPPCATDAATRYLVDLVTPAAGDPLLRDARSQPPG